MNSPEAKKAQGLANINAEEWQGLAVKGVIRQAVEDDINRRAADPGLNTEPAAGDQPAGKGRNARPPGAKGRAQQYRKRYPVFGPGMADQDHRHQNNDIAEQNGNDRLPP